MTVKSYIFNLFCSLVSKGNEFTGELSLLWSPLVCAQLWRDFLSQDRVRPSLAASPYQRTTVLLLAQRQSVCCLLLLF